MYVESHIDNTNTTSKNPNIGSALTLSTCISIGTRVHAGELEKPSQLSSAFPKSIVDIFGPGSVCTLYRVVQNPWLIGCMNSD